MTPRFKGEMLAPRETLIHLLWTIEEMRPTGSSDIPTHELGHRLLMPGEFWHERRCAWHPQSSKPLKAGNCHCSYPALEQELRMLRAVHYRQYLAVSARYVYASRRPREIRVLRGRHGVPVPRLKGNQQLLTPVAATGWATVLVEEWPVETNLEHAERGVAWLTPRHEWRLPKELMEAA